MPIIVPVVMPPVEHKVNCIVEGGVRYCENKDLKANEVGVILLFVAIIISWFALWMYIGEIFNSILITFGMGLLFPLVVGGFILLLI